MKKQLLLSLVLLLWTFGIAVGQEFVVGDLKYTVTSQKNHEVSVGAANQDISGDIIIPAKVDLEGIEYQVSSIGESAFVSCSNLTAITIPESVTSIKKWAFLNCNCLTAVTIPETVTSIGARAFDGCSSLITITIPESVTSIEIGAFFHCKSLTTITIPESVTSIGSAAFSGCSSLTSFNIPESVTAIGNRAFQYCSSLTTITIPGSVTSIGDYAFCACEKMYEIIVDSNNDKYISSDKSLFSKDMSTLIQVPGGYESTSYNIPESVTSIEIGAFFRCMSLVTIIIPESVTYIGSSAFNSCSSLTSITIPEGVVSIGESAFNGCSSLTSITIPKGVTAIGDHSFYNCNNLSQFYSLNPEAPEAQSISFEGLPSDAVLYVPKGSVEAYASATGWSVFSDIREIDSENDEVKDASAYPDLNFTVASEENREVSVAAANQEISGDITIPAVVKIDGIVYSVTSIGIIAFEGCSNLTSITIPKGVTTIDHRAFEGCSNLTDITLPEGVTSIGNRAFYYCSSLKTINIPESVTYIGQSAFFQCQDLTSINIPEGVTSIEYGTFVHCHSLASVTIPEGVIKIDSSAFYYCLSLSSITIPESVTIIGSNAFSHCENLTTITIPQNVEIIGGAGGIALASCSNLKEIVVDSNNQYFTSINKSLFSKDMSVLLQVPAGYESESYTIPNGVTRIGNGAFLDCNTLTTIIISEGVTSIGNRAFKGCGRMTSITIPESVISIGWDAFRDCTSLPLIAIPQNITQIGPNSFLGCTQLKEIVVDSNNEVYTSYNNSLFSKDKALLIRVPEGYESKTYTVPEEVTIISDAAFKNCSKLTSITIPKGVTAIEGDAFCNCSDLTLIDIPEGIKSIGVGAFIYCRSLPKITIPESVTSIGDQAFSFCDSLYEIYSLNPEVPEVRSPNFQNLPSNAILYVPKGCVEAYASAEGWSVFSDIREIKDQTYIVAFNVVYGETPIEGATVTFLDQEYTTDENGRVVIADIDVEEGSAVKYTVYKYGYQLAEGEVEFGEETEMTVDVKLVAAEASLTVKIFAGYNPVEGAYMEFEGKEYFSDEAGSIAVTSLNALDYMGKTVKFTVYKDGYQFYEGEADFTEGLDAFVIVDLVAAEATLTVKVMDGENPVVGARVTVLDSEYTTDENGEVKITGIDGPAVIGKTFAVTVEKEGYEIFEGEADFTETLDAYVFAELVNIQTAIADIIADIDCGDVKAYDLQGRRVTHPESGQVYIINGQKMLIKR